MTQRGQLLIYSWLAAAAVMMVMGISIKVQSSRLQSCKTEAAAFKANVEALGKLAEAEKLKKEAQDAKQIQDALTQRDVALRRLSSVNARRSPVSDNSAGAAAGSTVCIPTTAYNSAMGEFGKSLERFLAETGRYAQVGDEAQIDAVSLIQAWPLKMDTLKP